MIDTGLCRTPVPRVLIADDERLIADTLGAIFRSQGYEPLSVYNGTAAILAAQDLHPEVAILDYEMPGANGVEVAARLLESVPTCRVYVLSAYVGTSLPDDGKRVDGIAYIRKPIAPEDLIARVQR